MSMAPSYCTHCGEPNDTGSEHVSIGCTSVGRRRLWEDEIAKLRGLVSTLEEEVRVLEHRLTFKDLTAVNRTRAEVWHPGFPDNEDTWTGGDWGCCMAGEVGEACNVIKKLRRVEEGIRDSRIDPADAGHIDMLKRQLADELADTVIYADLIATYYHIDLADAIVEKFNAVSRRESIPVYLKVRYDNGQVLP